MNAIRRINPRRPYTHTAEGLKRIVLGQSASVGEDASTPAQAGAASAAKPLRSQAPAVRRMLAVAHSERGALSAGARQAVAAAALLAQADTAVHLLVFGDCRDDPAALGADMLIQAQAPAAHAPDLALAALLAEIAGDPPLHIFMSDEDPDDADLGRRLGAHRLHGGDGRGLAERQRSLPHGRPGAARPLPLPRILLLAADAVDEALPCAGRGLRRQLPGRRRPRAIANRRASSWTPPSWHWKKPI